MADISKDAAEIMEKVQSFETDHAAQLSDFSRNSRLYRAIPQKKRRENQSNTFYPEMLIEDEALATAAHEMVFSDSSTSRFFQFSAKTQSTDDRVRAWVSQAAITEQIAQMEMERKTLPFFRKLILQGTYPVNVSWRQEFKTVFDGVSKTRRSVFDSWDFEPFDILNFGFDDSAEDVERAEFCYRVRHVKPQGAMKMRRLGIWDPAVVDAAINSGFVRNPYETSQRQDAGYFDSKGASRGLTAIEYYGTLSSRGDEDTYWAVLDRETGRFLKQPQLNPFRHGEKPWLISKWISLPGEFYALGIGALNYRTQSELNDRRNFINDLLYSSLYNMWLKRSDSGIQFQGNKMRWRPHEIIEADGISDEFFRALRPDMAALPAAINIEQSDIERMRRVSGATSSLQAVATGVTATESQSIQSEATRRVKAMVRSEIASFFRKTIIRAHQLNLQFLSRPLSAKFTGDDGYEVFGEVSQEDLILNPDVKVKITTDLDFRPFKRRELIELLSTFGQLQQNGLLGQRQIVPDPIIEELAATYDMDPRKFFSREGLVEMETQRQMESPEVQGRAIRDIIGESPAAQQVLQNGPESLAGAQ